MIRQRPDGVEFDIRVIPRARRTEISGTRDGRLVVRIAAPPVEGAANEALVTFLAARLRVPARAVHVLSGEHGRQKRVAVDHVTAAHVEASLLRK